MTKSKPKSVKLLYLPTGRYLKFNFNNSFTYFERNEQYYTSENVIIQDETKFFEDTLAEWKNSYYLWKKTFTNKELLCAWLFGSENKSKSGYKLTGTNPSWKHANGISEEVNMIYFNELEIIYE